MQKKTKTNQHKCEAKAKKKRLGSKSSEFWSFVGFDLLPQTRIPSWWHGLFPWVLCRGTFGKAGSKALLWCRKKVNYSKHTAQSIPFFPLFLMFLSPSLIPYIIFQIIEYAIEYYYWFVIWYEEQKEISSFDIVEIRNNLWKSML